MAQMTMRGEYRIEAVDKTTGKTVRVWKLHNKLTNINFETRAKMLTGAYDGGIDALKIKYFALGDGTTAPTAADTQLANERFRKQVTQQSMPATGVVQTTVSIETAEADFHVREIGVFCGPSATSTAGSGTMISRALVDIDNNSNIVLNIIRTDTCGEG